MEVRIHESWKQVLRDEFAQPYFTQLSSFVRDEYGHAVIYPPPKLIFNAFDQCPFDAVRVVVLGQDPYHGKGQAHGLCFSVPEGVRMPPSLMNVFKEIRDDVGTPVPDSGDLGRWARQGVLLLNTSLTVRAGLPGSHQGKGWETFTDAVIKTLSEQREHVVFMLWGNFARSKRERIDTRNHLVLEAAHPSPYSAASGFFGCKHFSQANAYLEAHGCAPVVW